MNKAIILAAGESYDTSDIFPKILLKNPISNKTILDSFLEIYGNNTIFVLGFRSLSVLNNFPEINVVINHSWSTTKSAHSLSLAINTLPNEEIVDIYSGDYFIDKKFFQLFTSNKSENLLVGSFRESRSSKACNLEIKDSKIIRKYFGRVKNNFDPESLGIIRTKVSNIKEWINASINNYKSKYTTDLIPDEKLKDFELFVEEDNIFEINNSNDFLKYRDLKK